MNIASFLQDRQYGLVSSKSRNFKYKQLDQFLDEKITESFVNKVRKIVLSSINLLPLEDAFWCIYSRPLLKTLWQNKKLLLKTALATQPVLWTTTSIAMVGSDEDCQFKSCKFEPQLTQHLTKVNVTGVIRLPPMGLVYTCGKSSNCLERLLFGAL